MLFNSFTFIVFLIITFGLYYIPKLKKAQVLLLILSSLVFYSYDQFHYVLLLLSSASINILTSYYIVYGNAKKKKALALTGVVLNLVILAFFKYSTLISLTFLNPDDSIGHFMLHLPLPIGISFFTFEGISLLVDVWKEKHVSNDKIVSKSLSKHAQHTLFFISFFPHLVSGPILKAYHFFPQIGDKYFKDIQWQSVVKDLITGYFLKMVVADNLKDFTYILSYPTYENCSTLGLIIAMFGFSVQIFADFAGYSLIAIGLAKLFGYEFNINFNFPFIATSFKDFWRRWHISLSTFLMEYLYFSLGGNKKGKFRTYFNLIITMTLGGLWHGAAWGFALWGLLHGCVLALERWITRNKTDESKNIFVLFFKMSFVFTTVSVFLLLFKLPNIANISSFFNALVNNVSLFNDLERISLSIIYMSPIFVYHALYLCREKPVWRQIKKVEYLFYSAMLLLIVTNSGSKGLFIYFQF